MCVSVRGDRQGDGLPRLDGLLRLDHAAGHGRRQPKAAKKQAGDAQQQASDTAQQQALSWTTAAMTWAGAII